MAGRTGWTARLGVGRGARPPEPEAKKAKEEESPVAAVLNPLGALAGLGDYSSSEEED